MKRLLIKALLASTISTVSLLALDIPTYYNLDLQAMQLTLDGSKERLACLQANCSKEAQYAIDDKIQKKIYNLYAYEGTTPSKHIGFYTQHQKEAQDYFDNNISLQAQYSAIEAEIETINDALKALMEAAQ
jgi:hypothetical protein